MSAGLRLASPWLACAGLVFACFLVYWPGLDGGFVFDDMPNIVQNLSLQVQSLDPAQWLTATFSSVSSRLQRPLAMLSFAANHYFTGLDPRAMKLTNIAIHALNACLAFALARGLQRAAQAAAAPAAAPAPFAPFPLFVAAAWVLHPINLMAVLFVVQRMESLSHVFVFAGLWLYLDGRLRQAQGRAGGWWRVLAALVGGTLLGVASKESAALLPLYAFLLEVFVLRFAASEAVDAKRLRWMYVLGLLLPAIVAAVLIAPSVLREGAFSSRGFTPAERLLTELRVVLDYLRWCLLPNLGELGLYHDDYVVSRGWLAPPSTLLAGIALAIAAAAAWAVRRRWPLAALGIAWFFAAQLLTATVVPLELMFEHRNYFASFGTCLALGALLLDPGPAPRLRRIAALLACALVLLYAAQTRLRASEWDNPVRFVATEVAKHPDSPRATYELARMLVNLTDYDPRSPRLPEAFAAIERAQRVPGSTVLPAQAGLILAARTGQPLREEWWADLRHKLRTQPLGPQSMGALGALVDCANVRLCDFPREQMLRVFESALARGDSAEVLNLFGSYAVNTLGDAKLSLAMWQEAVRLSPGEPQYRINLTRLLIALGAHDEARAEIARLRALGRMGQYEARARALEEELRKRAAARPAPAAPAGPAGPAVPAS